MPLGSAQTGTAPSATLPSLRRSPTRAPPLSVVGPDVPQAARPLPVTCSLLAFPRLSRESRVHLLRIVLRLSGPRKRQDLIIVDMENDFVAEGAPLRAKMAPAVIPPLKLALAHAGSQPDC